MKPHVYLVVTLTFVIGILGYIVLTKLKKYQFTNLEKAYIIKPVEQNSNDRMWREVHFDFFSIVDDLISSYWIINDINENFYVANNDDNKIKKFHASDGLINSIGIGRGRGPGEIAGFDGFFVDNSLKIWVTDESNGRFTIYKQDGSFEIFHSSEILTKVLPLADDTHYVAEYRFDSQLKIKSIVDDQVEYYSESLLKNEGQQWAYVLNSTLAKDSYGGFIRVFYWINDFVRYNNQGEIIYFRRPVNPPSLADLIINPPRRYESGQEVWFNEVDPSSRLQRTADAKVYNDQIHLLIIEFRNGVRYQDFVDVYELHYGDYLYSYRLPQSLYTFTVTENYLAGILWETGELLLWNVNDKW
jgi:hypothetical protein